MSTLLLLARAALVAIARSDGNPSLLLFNAQTEIGKVSKKVIKLLLYNYSRLDVVTMILGRLPSASGCMKCVPAQCVMRVGSWACSLSS